MGPKNEKPCWTWHSALSSSGHPNHWILPSSSFSICPNWVYVIQDELTSRMYKLESLTMKETKLWWDCTTLQSNADKAMIPSGLRMKKFLSFTYPETFKQQWENVLTQCSHKLIKLIITHEQETLTQIQMDISTLQATADIHATSEEYKKRHAARLKHISKLEDQITDTKKRKFARDATDYQRGEVYTWPNTDDQTKFPRSILKHGSPHCSKKL